MVRDTKALREFEMDFLRREGEIPFEKNLRIFEALWREAVSLGVIPSANPLEGIETAIKIAKVLNSCSKSSSLK